MGEFLVMIVVGLSLFLSLAVDVHVYSDAFIVKSILIRFVALVCFFSFVSIQRQLIGLIGVRGLVPINNVLDNINSSGALLDNLFRFEFSFQYVNNMLSKFTFWKYNAKNLNQNMIDMGRIDIILALIAAIRPHPVLIAYLLLSQLALKRIMSDFIDFQFDALLIEMLLLSFILTLSQDKLAIIIGVWHFKVLLFRVMSSSILTKYYGRIDMWNGSYSAMCYQFLVQPLPTKLGLFLHCHSPKPVMVLLTRIIMLAEAVLTFSVLFANLIHWHWYASWCIAALTLARGLTGYYGFTNILLLALCCSLLTDDVLPTFTPIVGSTLGETSTSSTVAIGRGVLDIPTNNMVWFAFSMHFVNSLLPSLIECVVLTIMLVVFVLQITAMSEVFAEAKVVCPSSTHSISTKLLAYLIDTLHHTRETFGFGNTYGLLTVPTMTKVRNELTLEVSDDLSMWQSVEFRYKPGSMHIAPKAVTPFFHMPRLDWCMWFLPLQSGGKYQYPRWFWVLLAGIMEGNKDILSLLHPHTTEVIQCMCDTHYRKHADDESKPPRRIRVSLDNYSRRVLTASRKRSNSTHELETTNKGAYWSVVRIEQLQAPLKLDEVRCILRSYDNAEEGDGNDHDGSGEEMEAQQQSLEESVYADILKECMGNEGKQK